MAPSAHDHEPPSSGEDQFVAEAPLGSASTPDDSRRLAGHEIRSQLTVLSGYLAMLEDGSLGTLPVAARSALAPMRAKVLAISRLVDDMLEDVRSRDGRLRLSRRRFDLRATVRSAADEIRLDLAETHRLEVGLPDDPVVVEADPRRVATILRNLLDNAIKYSPDGGAIECRLEVGGGDARVSVRDHGLGIEPNDAERLFQRFERGEDSIEGVGLGLYISRMLARLHGGDIMVSSPRDGGSEFTVILPLAGRHGDTGQSDAQVTARS